MPPSPLVSVLIPAYNAEATIAHTLASACRQTYTALEILVVDDGSTDETAARVRSVAARDSRVRLLRQSNQGVAAARNHALHAAHGSLIAPLDADDLWLPTKIERQVEQIQAAGPGTGLVYTWWASIDAHDRVVGIAHPWRLTGHVLEALVHLNFIGNASVPLFRRDVLDAVGGYRTSLKARGGQGCEDWDVALRVAEHTACAVAPGYLVGYRATPRSMSSCTLQMATSFHLMMDDLTRRNDTLPRSVVRASRGHFFDYLAGQAFGSGAPRTALRHAWESLRSDPARLLVPHLWRLFLYSILAQWGSTIGSSAPPSGPPLHTLHNVPLSDLPQTAVYQAPGQKSRSWRPFDWVERWRWARTRARCSKRPTRTASPCPSSAGDSGSLAASAPPPSLHTFSA